MLQDYTRPMMSLRVLNSGLQCRDGKRETLGSFDGFPAFFDLRTTYT